MSMILDTIHSHSHPLDDTLAYQEEIARLKRELEEERKKSATLEQNLAASAKFIKQQQSELEYVKSKIATAMARKESATGSDLQGLRMSSSGSSSPNQPASLHSSASNITNNAINAPVAEVKAAQPQTDGRISKVEREGREFGVFISFYLFGWLVGCLFVVFICCFWLVGCFACLLACSDSDRVVVTRASVID
jgi:hypothetical protein